MSLAAAMKECVRSEIRPMVKCSVHNLTAEASHLTNRDFSRLGNLDLTTKKSTKQWKVVS